MKTIIFLTTFLLILQMYPAKKDVNFKRVANCPEYRNLTAVYQNIVFTKNNKGKPVSFRMELLIKKELKRMMIMVTLMKCANSENLDSCEYFMKDFKVKNACDIMGKDNQIWTETLANSNFPKSCPIATGTYKINETKINSEMQLTLMPVPIALWKIKFITFDSGNDNVLVGCVNVDVEVYNARRY